MGDRDRDPTLSRAIELRQSHARDADGFAEQPCLLDAILARGRVDDEEGLVRRALELLGDHASNFCQLLHQVRLGVQTAGGIDDYDVATAAGRSLDRVVGNSGRVATPFSADEIGPGALGPDLELLLGGGAEGVCRAKYHRPPVVAQAVGELADRRRLTRAVDADHQDNARLPVQLKPRRLAEKDRRLLGQRLAEIADLAARLEPLHELGRRRHADVGRDQGLLETLPGCVVSRIEGSGRDLISQRPAAFAERVSQSREEPTRVLARFPAGAIGVAQELLPGAAHASGTFFRSRSFSRRAAGSRWSATIPAMPAPTRKRERRMMPIPTRRAPTVKKGPSTKSERSTHSIVRPRRCPTVAGSSFGSDPPTCLQR